MKVYLVFLSVLSLAFAGNVFNDSPIKFGFCKSPSISSDFKTEEFFSGKWFVSHYAGNLFFDGFGSCAGVEARIESEKINLLLFQYQPQLSRYISVQGKGKTEFSRFGGLAFPIEYKLFDNFNITVPYSVVGTDYNNWAVVYFCYQLFGAKIEMSWVLTRERNSAALNKELSKIRESLGFIGMKLEDFTKEDNHNCAEGEPHL